MIQINSRRALFEFIQNDRLLRALLDWVRPHFGTDPGHDLEHAVRVCLWTLHLSPPSTPESWCIAAALLHDVVQIPKNDPRRAEASTLAARKAEEILTSLGASKEMIETVCGAVEDHSFSSGRIPRSSLADALQDADRLDALGAVGVMRAVSTGSRMGAIYYDATDPFAEDRELDDRRFTIDHFETKLCSLHKTMRTPAGSTEALRRTAWMRSFLQQLRSELST